MTSGSEMIILPLILATTKREFPAIVGPYLASAVQYLQRSINAPKRVLSLSAAALVYERPLELFVRSFHCPAEPLIL